MVLESDASKPNSEVSAACVFNESIIIMHTHKTNNLGIHKTSSSCNVSTRGALFRLYKCMLDAKPTTSLWDAHIPSGWWTLNRSHRKLSLNHLLPGDTTPLCGHCYKWSGVCVSVGLHQPKYHSKITSNTINSRPTAKTLISFDDHPSMLVCLQEYTMQGIVLVYINTRNHHKLCSHAAQCLYYRIPLFLMGVSSAAQDGCQSCSAAQDGVTICYCLYLLSLCIVCQWYTWYRLKVGQEVVWKLAGKLAG